MIRTISIHELDSLGDLATEFYASSRHLECFDPALFRDIWTQLIGNESGAIFAALDGDKPIGAIGCFSHRDLYSRAIITEEMFFFVSKDARGVVGPKLYREFEKWSRLKGAETIQMCFLEDLMPEKVGNFYRRMGLTPVETRYSKRLTA